MLLAIIILAINLIKCINKINNLIKLYDINNDYIKELSYTMDKQLDLNKEIINCDKEIVNHNKKLIKDIKVLKIVNTTLSRKIDNDDLIKDKG